MRLCPWQRLSPIIRPTISFSGSLRSSWRRSPRWDSCCGLFSVPARAICCAWRNIWHERRTAGSLSARKNDRANTRRAVTRPPPRAGRTLAVRSVLYYENNWGSKPLRERNREESILLALKALDTATEADTATGGGDRHGKIFPIIKIVTGAGVETVADDKLSELFQTQVA